MSHDHTHLPMRAQDYSELGDWPGYFASVVGKGARETLLAALDRFDEEGFMDIRTPLPTCCLACRNP